jgi:hypothetical protein
MGADLKDMQRTNKAAAQPVSDRARDIAPHLTGALSRSVRPTATQREGAVLSGSRAVPYAGPIHFGWPARNIEPQPFLYDALDDRRDQVVEVYEARVESLVRKLDRETP